MNYVIVRNGVADEIHGQSVDGAIQCAGEIGPGWLYVNEVFVKPEPTIDDVKAECLKRRKLAIGLDETASKSELDYKRSTGMEDAIALQYILITGGTLTTDQQTRVAQLEQRNTDLGLVREKSNVLQIRDPIPADFTDNKWWNA
ncbi:MAG: hypothetical protein COB90_09760 [Hyphomicrobiales bacterium]|nr:MAG: hypothetical protein COB90_09760 [Hyphomicrobiales bacterium]